MPLMQTAFPVSRISGRSKNAPTVSSFNGGQQILRAYTPPAQPDTTGQTTIRAIFSLVTKNWKLLTVDQRDGWEEFAKENPVKNRLGTEVKRNGLSAYVELASLHYIDTGALLAAPPVLTRPAPPTAITSVATDGGEVSVTVNHGYSTLTGLKLVVRQTPTTIYESQKPKPSDYRLIMGVDTASIVALAASGSSYSFDPTKYPPAEGDWQGYAVSIMNAEGWESEQFRRFLIVDPI